MEERSSRSSIADGRRRGRKTPSAHFGETTLTRTLRNGNSDILRLLIESGVDVNAASPFGLTPLSTAVVGGHTEIAKLLREAGADMKIACLTACENWSGTSVPVVEAGAQRLGSLSFQRLLADSHHQALWEFDAPGLVDRTLKRFRKAWRLRAGEHDFPEGRSRSATVCSSATAE